MDNAQLINQTSGETEIYTPMFILTAARAALGGRIDLDPASCLKANKRVQARSFFSKEDDGLKQKWYGAVWMNHPFHAGWKACTPDCKRKSCIEPNKKTGKVRGHIFYDIPSNADWINKYIREYEEGAVEAACCITFASTSEEWFRPLLNYPQCYLSPRTNYELPDGTPYTGVTKGSVVTYLGEDVKMFATAFHQYGVTKVRFPL